MAENFESNAEIELNEQWNELNRCKVEMEEMLRNMSYKIDNYKTRVDSVDRLFDDYRGLIDV